MERTYKRGLLLRLESDKTAAVISQLILGSNHKTGIYFFFTHSLNCETINNLLSQWDPKGTVSLSTFVGHSDLVYAVSWSPQLPNCFASVSGTCQYLPSCCCTYPIQTHCLYRWSPFMCVEQHKSRCTCRKIGRSCKWSTDMRLVAIRSKYNCNRRGRRAYKGLGSEKHVLTIFWINC